MLVVEENKQCYASMEKCKKMLSVALKLAESRSLEIEYLKNQLTKSEHNEKDQESFTDSEDCLSHSVCFLHYTLLCTYVTTYTVCIYCFVCSFYN